LASRNSSGSLVTHPGGTTTGQDLKIRNCTAFSGFDSLFHLGSNSFTANFLSQYRNNLVWSDNGVNYGSAYGPYLVNIATPGGPAATALNIWTQAAFNNNAEWNAKDNGYANINYSAQGGVGLYYNINEDSNSGANPFGQADVNLGSGGFGPIFIDLSRNFKSWAVSIGCTGTNYQIIKGGLDALRAANDPTDPNFKAGASVVNFQNYIVQGFAPTNSSIATAGDDGSTIGAVPFVQVSPATWNAPISAPVIGSGIY
jgi:hypothetical protein